MFFPRSLRLVVLGVALAAMGAPAHAQFAYGRIVIPNLSPEAGDAFGHAIFFAGDLTGDGVSDYVVAQRDSVDLYDGATHVSVRSTGYGFLRRVLALGDVDGDGTPDFAADSTIVSTATGQPLFTLASPTPEYIGLFGNTMVAMGDLDGDGRSEIAVGAPREFGGGERSGQVHLFDGATGQWLRTLRSPAPAFDGRFGDAIVVLDDIDGDGTPDLAIDAPGEPESPSVSGHVYVISGATGALLRTLTAPAMGQNSGGGLPTMYPVGDQTGDGRTDLGVWRPPNRVFVYDGWTGALVRTMMPPAGANGYYGRPIVSLGDRTGDGLDEIAVALGNTSPGAVLGRVYVHDGGSGAILDVVADPGDSAEFQSNLADFGEALAGGADLDGDGLGDLLVGSPGWAMRDANGNYRGGVGRLYFYPLQRAPDDRRDFGIFSPGLVLLDDRDDDGWSDFAAGEGRYDSDTGQRLVAFTGGAEMARTADLDADGSPDLLVGDEDASPTGTFRAGRARLISTGTGVVVADLVSPTPQTYGGFGLSVATGADLDGDGTPDYAVGSVESVLFEDDGRVHVFSGADRTLLYSLVSPTPDHAGEFGRSLALVPDLDGDGRADLVVGAQGEDVAGVAEAGRAHVFSGATGSLIYTVSTPNPADGGWFGSSVVSVPDADADGVADLAVAAVRESGNDSRAGRVYIVSGATGAVLHTLSGPDPGAMTQFGTSLSAGGDAGGDADGDGRADLLVGASIEAVGTLQRSGAAYLLRSSTWTPLARYVSPFPEADGRFGVAVALGDVDGDGRADVLVSARDEDDYIPGGHTYLFLSAETFPTTAGPPPTSPAGMSVEAVWPNPARGTARIRFDLPAPATVRLGVFDALGRRVLTLDAAPRAAGRHEVALDVSGLATGLYVVRLATGDAVATRRLSVVR